MHRFLTSRVWEDGNASALFSVSRFHGNHIAPVLSFRYFRLPPYGHQQLPVYQSKTVLHQSHLARKSDGLALPTKWETADFTL